MLLQIISILVIDLDNWILNPIQARFFYHLKVQEGL